MKNRNDAYDVHEKNWVVITFILLCFIALLTSCNDYDGEIRGRKYKLIKIERDTIMRAGRCTDSLDTDTLWIREIKLSYIKQ